MGVPLRDLVVSPHHRILSRSKIARNMFGCHEVLVAAKDLLFLDGIDDDCGPGGVKYVRVVTVMLDQGPATVPSRGRTRIGVDALREALGCAMRVGTGSKDICMPRLFALLSVIVLLAACTNPNDLDQAPVDLGDFRLGHNVVVASKMTRGPLSREASEEEWKEAMTSAIDERFGRYEGDKLYHLGVSVEGYVLAQPGIPLVASPNSVLIVLLTVWDDAAGGKLNTPPEQITIMETISGNTILGSGLTQSKEVQMRNLSRNAAKQIENFLVRRRASEGWFGAAPGPVVSAPASAVEAADSSAAAVETPPAPRPVTPVAPIAPPAGAIMAEPVVAPFPDA